MNGGFFTSTEAASSESLSRMTGCGACGLYRHCLSPKMEATGKNEKGILVIAEAPGEEEDRKNKHLVGETGQFLRDKLRPMGIDLDRDCRKINAVNCRPPKNRTPTSQEIAHCRPRVWAEIATSKAHLILLLGNAAVESFLGHRWKKDLGGISKWRGWSIPDREVNAWVCPTFHPSYVQREIRANRSVVDAIFESDLRHAFRRLDRDTPKFLREQGLVERVTDPRRICTYLESLATFGGPVALDYETTGLKPQAPGHRVVSCAFSTSGTSAFSFLLPKGGPTISRLREVLQNPEIEKRAHNMKFEDTWSTVALQTPVNGWGWDSMLAAHVLDNRSGITSLKFQAYIHFGLIDYDSHIEPFLKSTDDNLVGNGFNRIHEIPVDDLLTYGGMDSMLEFRLSEIQMKKMR